MIKLRKKLTDSIDFANLSNEELAISIQEFHLQYPDAPRSFFFDCHTIRELLEQPHCQSIRIYFALDSNNKQRLVIVGTDALLNDMLRGKVAVSSPFNESTDISSIYFKNNILENTKAAEWTANYRRSVTGTNSYYGFLHDANTICSFSDSTRFVGIRFYYALNSQKQVIIVSAGVTSEGKLVFNHEPLPPCPPCCSWEDWWSILGYSLNQDGPRSQQLRVTTAVKNRLTYV